LHLHSMKNPMEAMSKLVKISEVLSQTPNTNTVVAKGTKMHLFNIK